MSAEPKKVGDSLGLEAQLGDGATNVLTTRIFAILRELDGTNIGTEFELIHVGDGKYTDETRVMPDFDKISVTYFIRLADGTTPSNIYIPNVLSEQFVKDVTGQIIEDSLSGGIASNDAIEGQIEVAEYLIGTIDAEETLQGIVEDDTILIGEIDEC